MDSILYQFLDPHNDTHKDILDLINKGLVEYALNDETGEFMLSLTERGQEVCKGMFGD